MAVKSPTVEIRCDECGETVRYYMDVETQDGVDVYRIPDLNDLGYHCIERGKRTILVCETCAEELTPRRPIGRLDR